MLHISTFEYLKPTQTQIDTMVDLRKASADYANLIDLELPEGGDKAYILRRIRETAMWINVAIARHADGTPRE